MEETKTFKGFEDVTKVLVGKNFFDMQNGLTVEQNFRSSASFNVYLQFARVRKLHFEFFIAKL